VAEGWLAADQLVPIQRWWQRLGAVAVEVVASRSQRLGMVRAQNPKKDPAEAGS